MSLRVCPICDGRNPASEIRCLTCGADFTDPDVMAMAESKPAAIPESSLGEAGALAGDKFLWVSLERLREGTALRTLAIVGSALLLVGFLLPVTNNLRDWLMPWKAADGGPTFALFFPAIAVVIGAAVVFAKAIPKHVSAMLLAAVGAAGLLLVLAPLGKFAGAPRETVWLLQLGLMVSAVGMTIRIYRPRDDNSRYAIIAGAVLAAVGLIMPLSKATTALPVEFMFYINHDFKDMSLLSADLKGIDHDLMVRFLALWSLVPLALLPAAAGFAWQKPGGVWDKSSAALRPMAWAVVLYVPATYFLLTFNVTGWREFSHVGYQGGVYEFRDFTTAMMVGRIKLGLLATGFALWLAFAGFVVYEHFVGAPAVPEADASDSAATPTA